MPRWARMTLVGIIIATAAYFLSTWLLKMLATIGGIALAVFLYYLASPRNAQIILGHLLRLVDWFGSGIRESIVKNRVEGYTNKTVEEFNKESGGATPYPLKIKWVPKNLTPESFLKSGKVVVKLNYKEPDYKNIVDAALLYCRSGLIPDTREYIRGTLLRAFDLETVDAFLKRNKIGPGRIYFRNEVLSEQFNKSPATESWFTVVEGLEDRGYFSRILLVELTRYPGKASYKAGRKPHHQEIEDFVAFLQGVANFPCGGETQLDFIRERLQVGIIIVGKPKKLQVEGYAPYLYQIKLCLDRGAEVVYLIGYKEVSAEIPSIARAAEHDGLARIVSIRRFYAVSREGAVVPAHCARLESQPGD